MDRVVAARKLIGDLVKAEAIEVRRVEIVGRDLAKLIETSKRPPTGQDLGEWLEEHQQVTELSASTALLDELIDRYLRDGEAEAVTESRDPDLERQLREDPGNVSSYQVYADWLQERTDPLGELIALGVASTTDSERFERHLKRHEAHFLGGMATELATRVRLGWRFGFVQSIEALGELGDEMWQRLLDLRVCELVESITVRQVISGTLEHAIAGAASDTLRILTLEALDGRLPATLLQRPLRTLSLRGPAARALDANTLPSSLERLAVFVTEINSLAPLELGVKDLEIVPTAPNIAFLVQTKLPRLERLTLELGHADASVVIELLEKIRVPALAHLELRSGQLDAKTFRTLAELPLSAELRSLGLVNLGLTDDAIEPIAATRGFSSLEEIDVSHNELTREGLETARGLASSVISTRQSRPGQSMEKRVRKLAGSRLQAAEEIADPKAWKRAGVDGDIRWARYRGEAEYELYITADLSRYGCSCPSSIQPCKHVIALGLVAERTTLPAAPSNGIEARVNTRGGLTGLLVASIEPEE